jgi:integrase/recombinase XerD
MITYKTFPALLQAFFTERLMNQRQASPHTIASYRDTFCLMFSFLAENHHKTPSMLKMDDLDVPVIPDFLDWLESNRHNSIRTRNARLAAIHSFFTYAAFHDPAHSALIQRILAIPGKRYVRNTLEYLTRDEVEALIAAPDLATWSGRRDRTMLLVDVQTGLRVSELISLDCRDVELGSGAHVHCIGKGRKERCTPLRKEAVEALRNWLNERDGQSDEPLFPNARGTRLSRDGVEYLLKKHARKAAVKCPALERKNLSPHVLRHTAAMDLLEHGVDQAVIALWLGHEKLETVQEYVHASLAIKERALEKITPLDVEPGRYHPDDQLLNFLRNL